ncbi:hypothetical protein F441_06692 [Phytophthora nicotianae CJ01A1]|nr:hypothetical protein F441_06692 [Phytophthora nicotianae CJ01A1]
MSSRKTGRSWGTRKTSDFKAATTTISDKGNNKRSRAPETDKALQTGENVKNVETGKKMKFMENGEEVDSNKKVESAEGGEIVESVEASKNVKSGHSVEGSERGENGESEVEKQASKSKVGSVDSVKSAENVENTDTVESVGSTEYVEGVDTMASSEGDFDGKKKIVTIVAPFPKVPIKSWTEFDTILASYTKSHNLHFRVRRHRQHTTETTRMKYLQVFRNRKARYCGCLARFTPTVMKVDGGTFQIFIRNENHTHSHLNTRADAASYMTTKTLPIDEQDREDVKTLADARASSKQITDFLNDRTAELHHNKPVTKFAISSAKIQQKSD